MSTQEYGCLLLVLPEGVRRELTDWCIDNIPEFHWGLGGIEYRSHCTIKYGLRSSSPETVAALRVLLARHGPLSIRLADELSLFTGGKDGDVLKVDVEGEELRALNAEISASFACEDTHPVYTPHVTCAYLRPETSLLYKDLRPPFLGQQLLLTEAEWSGADGSRETIPLTVLPDLGLGGKALSFLHETSGGALVLPPLQRRPPVNPAGRKRFGMMMVKGSPFAKSLSGYSIKEGFTGMRKDKLGRRRCYQNGRPVPCPQAEESAQQPKHREQAAEAMRQTVAHLQHAGLKTLSVIAAAGVKAGAAEHWAVHKLSLNIAKLPKPAQVAVRGVYLIGFSTFLAGQAAARAVAREVGGEEHAVHVARSLTIADNVAAIAGKGMVTAGVGAGAAALVVPMASASYLAYSSVRHPVAVFRAAQGAVKAAARRIAGKKSLHFHVKAQGTPCEQGETAAQTECVPATQGGSRHDTAEAPRKAGKPAPPKVKPSPFKGGRGGKTDAEGKVPAKEKVASPAARFLESVGADLDEYRRAAEARTKAKMLEERMEKMEEAGDDPWDDEDFVEELESVQMVVADADERLVTSARKKFKEAFRSDDPGFLINRVDSAPALSKRMTEALAFYDGLVHRSFSSMLFITAHELPAGGRAYATGRGDIHLTQEDTTAVAAHEIGHLIEEHFSKPAQAFLKKRVGDEKPVSLSKKLPEHGYRKDEMGRKDHFDKAFTEAEAHYIGKVYESGATEVLSMGVQKLYEDPVTFAEKDPEYFDFVVTYLTKGQDHDW